MTLRIHSQILVRTLGLALLVLCLPSCGSNRVPCYPVQGEVFVRQGNERAPAAGALVVFHPTTPPTGDTPLPVAHVDETGKFALTTYRNGDGAPAGAYTITIEWRAPRPPPPHKPKETGDRLRGRYSDPRTSQIAYTVDKDKENNVPPIELGLR